MSAKDPENSAERVRRHRAKASCTEEQWQEALDRAARAKRYAEKMPEHIHGSDLVYQDPVWQLEEVVK